MNRTSPYTSSHGRAFAAVFSCGILIAASSLQAADQTYDATNVSNVWDLSTLNWDTSTAAWTNGNNAIFGGTGESVAVGSGVTVGDMTFNSTGYTLTGALDLTASGTRTVTVGSGLSTTISAAISGTGATLAKSGAGTLILSGANTYSGGTTLSAGTLTIGASSTPTSGTVTSGPLGTGALTLSGGTLNFNGAFTVANAITATTSTTTNVQTASGLNTVLNGNLTGGGNLNHTANGTTGQLQWGGDNSGYTGTYTQNGGNTSLTFNSATAGSASAAWVFNNGTNQRTRLNFGTGTISFGSLAGSGSIANIAASGMATVSAGALNTSTTFSGVLGGSTAGQGQNIALTKVGSGTLTLTGANTYTGATAVNAGTLALGAANRIADTSALVLNGGTFATGGFSETLNTLTLSTGSTIDFGSGTSALVFADSSGITWTGTLTLLNFTVGTDSLNFTSFSGLTVTQLSQISLSGFTATGLDASGFVQFSAIPEPGTYAAIAGALALGAAALPRRRRA